MALAVKRQQNEGSEAVEGLLPFLDANTQASVAKQVVQTIQEYIDQSDEVQQEQLFIAIRAQIELDRPLPGLVPLANQMGLTVEELVGTHVESYSHGQPPRCTIEQRQGFLAIAESSINRVDKLERLLRVIPEAVWPSTPEVLSGAQRLLELVLDR